MHFPEIERTETPILLPSAYGTVGVSKSAVVDYYLNALNV